MSQMKSRRELALLATGAAIATGLVVRATPAAARQTNMEHARASLDEALRALNNAYDDKGGHKANAVHLIEQAIVEINAGIEFADRH
jgi:hypothetical protein